MSNKKVEIWPQNSIYSSIKLLVSFEIKIAEKSDVMIDYVQPIFETVFGYSLSNLPLKLDKLISLNNDREDVADLYLAIISGRPKSLFINLKSQSGSILSCFISMICSSSKQTEDLNPLSVSQNSLHRKFAVMTIRSASAVGNTRFIGVGICSIAGVDLNILEDRVGKESNELRSVIQESTVIDKDVPYSKKLKTNNDCNNSVQRNYNNDYNNNNINHQSTTNQYDTTNNSFCNSELLFFDHSGIVPYTGDMSTSGNASPSYEMLPYWSNNSIVSPNASSK